MEMFIQGIEKPHLTIPVLHESKRLGNIEQNRHIINIIANAVLFCGRQCIGLRGSDENPTMAILEISWLVSNC